MTNQTATGLAPVAKSRISAGSIAKFFSGGSGVALESNFGTMCERAAVVAHMHASVKCRACEGKGYRELEAAELDGWRKKINSYYLAIAEETDREKCDALQDRQDEIRRELSRASDCPVCRGSGYTTQKNVDRATAMDSMFTTVRCSGCRGCGETFPPNDETAERQDVCLRCANPETRAGDGYFVPVTVKETGSSKKGKAPKTEAGGDEGMDGAPPTNDVVAASWVDEDELAERGRVSRFLERLRRSDPETAVSVELFNGPDGDKWGAHKWGRTFALWQATDAGIELARMGAERSSGAHGMRISMLDLIASERDAEVRASEPDPARRSLIAQADHEARGLKAKMDRALADSEAA